MVFYLIFQDSLVQIEKMYHFLIKNHQIFLILSFPLNQTLTGKCRLNFTKILDKVRIQNNGKKLRDFIPYWVKQLANLKITTFANCYKYRVRVITNGKCCPNFANDLD